jgi:hypothetical protein
MLRFCSVRTSKLAGEDVELARSAKVSEAPTWKLSLDVPLEIDA